MPGLFEKLNLKEQQNVLILDAPESFDPELEQIGEVRVYRRLADLKQIEFALAFVTRRTELDRVCRALIARAATDALLWIAYPKGTSKKYSCDFNRDEGWEVLRQSGFDSVRMVAIDEDWSALRFRRTEFIKRAR